MTMKSSSTQRKAHGWLSVGFIVCAYAKRVQSSSMQSHREFIVEPIGLDADQLARPIRWDELFGNDHPVELEIGLAENDP